MKRLTYLAFVAIAGMLFLATPQKSQAQVSFGIQIGPEPACPMGTSTTRHISALLMATMVRNGLGEEFFLGAGPWFHGPDHFHGHVDEHFDPHHGYRGAFPHRGERGDWDRHHGTVEHFNGHAVREEHAHHDDHH